MSLKRLVRLREKKKGFFKEASVISVHMGTTIYGSWFPVDCFFFFLINGRKKLNKTFPAKFFLRFTTFGLNLLYFAKISKIQ